MRLLTPARRSLLLGMGIGSLLSACVVAFDSGPREGARDDAGTDGSTPGTSSDGSAEGAAPDGSAPSMLFAFDDEENWEEHALAGSFGGAAFDGRYVYFVPRSNPTLWRYDTQGTFTDPVAWSSVELPSPDAGTSGFRGAAFSGGHIYFAPAEGTLFVRYPIAAAFTAASMQAFDVAPLFTEKKTGGSLGVVPFGGKLYFIPHEEHLLVRYDPAELFDSEKAWQVAAFPFAPTSDFAGSIATSAGLYLVPSGGSLAVFDGADMADAKSFVTGPALSGDFLGGATDGKDLYFAPAAAPVTMTFPVGGSLFSKAIVPTFDLQGFAACGGACFAGAVFDGRYVYYVPRNQARFVRYDAASPNGFTDPLSWMVGRPKAGKTGFYGGAFDGRYVYFAPDGSDRVLRFHAREPGAVPSSHSGSFL